MYSSTLANINDTSARAENCGGVAKNWIILIKRHTFDSFHLFENYILIDSQLPAIADNMIMIGCVSSIS